jgi:putative nucleotidyltransferase with HDIG domain
VNIAGKTVPEHKKTEDSMQAGENNTFAAEANYFPISPDTLNPQALTDFRVYLKRGGRFVLYTRERQYFTESLKQRLVENGTDTVFIPFHQQAVYEAYVFDNLEWILGDPEIPVTVRAQVFLDSTAKQVQDIFTKKLPALDETTLEGVRHVARSSLDFLSTPEAMANIGRFISHDYQTFSHSVHVFTYTMMLLRRMAPDFGEDSLVDIGVGALLHDIGKVYVPAATLNKPGKLDQAEWGQIRRHPVHGVRMCTNIAVSQTTLNCILFHHEKCDGSGYPTGMTAGEIPLPIRVITCCDVYDAITSKRPYAPARSAFEALKIMGEEMQGAVDPGVFRSFIQVLGRR